MSNVKFFKNPKAVLDNLEISDGQILYATDTKEHFLDHNGERIKFTPDMPQIPQIPEVPKNTDELPQGSTNLYDKPVALSAGSGISISGIYPNFTITNTGASGGGGSSSQLSGGYFGLTPLCVNFGNYGIVNYKRQPFLFDENLDFKVSEQNPLIVTFADRTSKSFTSILNANQIAVPQVPEGATEYDATFMLILDEDGYVDIIDLNSDEFIVTDNTFINPSNYKVYYTILHDNNYVSYYRAANSEAIEKKFVPLGEYKLSLANSVTTRTPITYPYNINGFDDRYSTQVISPLKLVTGTQVQLDYSQKCYKYNLVENTTLKLLPPKVEYHYSESRLTLNRFELYVYVTNTNLTLNFVNQYDSAVNFVGDVIGSKGAGNYLVEFFGYLGETNYFAKSTYIGRIHYEEPPIVDPNPQPENPFV